MEAGKMSSAIWAFPAAIFAWVARHMRLGQRVGRLEMQLQRFAEGYVSLIEILADLPIALHEAKSELERQEVSAKFTALLAKQFRDLISEEKKAQNPLTVEEIDLLEQYWHKVEVGYRFTVQEAQEFRDLAKKLKDDPKKKGESKLAAIGVGVIAGLALAWALDPASDNVD